MQRIFLITLLFIISLATMWSQKSNEIDRSLFLLKTISGRISPKSVVHNGNGLFFAQNMMYKHTVTVYNRKFELVATLKDRVKLSEFGFNDYKGLAKGSPVECAFSENGKYAWVSNYNMTNEDENQFVNPGCDNCSGKGKYDSSFVYLIATSTQKIIDVIKVGAVPKYLACTPDHKKVLVTNWSSGDMSIIDTKLRKEIKRVKIGTFPRGITIDSKSEFAYVAVMGSKKVAKVDLNTYKVTYFEGVGKGPRHLCISNDDKWLYLTINSENRLAKINIASGEVNKVKVGHQPRSMVLSGDGKFLYLVNYNDHNFSKIRTSDLKTIAITKTKKKPIGITYDAYAKSVWVASYTGYIQIFKDSLVKGKSYKIDTDAIESTVLNTTNSDAKISNISSKEIIQDSILVNDTINEDILVEKRSFLAMKRSFNYLPKKFTPKEKDTSNDAPSIVKEKSTEVSEVNLDATQPYIVILGMYSEPGNALKKQKKMSKKGVETGTFENKDTSLTYVFGYATTTREDAKKWIENKLPKDISSWIMKR